MKLNNIVNKTKQIMKTLQQLKERKDELENELSAYKWWGNEDDADYEEEYGREYEHLQTELDGVNEEIYKFRNPYSKGLENKTLELHTFKGMKITTLQKYIKHKIWLGIQKKCELKEKYQNGVIMGLKELGTELGRVQSGLEVRYEFPTKTYPNPKTLRINELGEQDTQPIENQSVTNY
jgi:chromosome segregation ATPase